MEASKYVTVFLTLFCWAPQAHPQGTFQNLAFESAVLVPIPGDPVGRVQFGPAFPGWNGYIGGVQQTNALYNLAALDSSAISIIDTNPSGWTIGVIQGRYSAVVQAGIGNGLPATDTTLLQIAKVPSGAETLRFTAYYASDDGLSSLVVSLGGQSLPLIPLQSESPFTIYGADIHGLAGQSAELAFTVLAQVPHHSNNTLFLDSITFSDLRIPEPSTFVLFAFGSLFFFYLRRR